jgi:excisionase family DNA binding protein
MRRGRSPKSLASQRRGLSAEQILAERAELLAALTRVRAAAREIRARLATLKVLAAQQAHQAAPRHRRAPDEWVIPGTLTIDQLAARLSVSPWTVRTWIRGGRIPIYRLGRRILVKQDDIAALLEQTYHPATRPASTNGPRPPDGGA